MEKNPPVRPAQTDTKLRAHVTDSTLLYYEEGKDDELDRPEHVRAASGLTLLEDHLVIVQDDSNFLAMVEIDTHRVKSLPLPAIEGDRTFSQRRGNIDNKLDLEAAVRIPDPSDDDLIGIGSGSYESCEWVLRVDWDGTNSGIELQEADQFYQSLRARTDFRGSGLNIEGAVFVDKHTLRLFQRGNAEPQEDLKPVDATGDVDWRQLHSHLENPSSQNPPSISNIVHYELGNLDGIPLTFSDAERVGDFILFSASAENRTGQEIAGSSLGVINGSVRMAELFDRNGEPFEGKIEGLQVHPDDLRHAYFVIDDDREDKPSRLYEASLEGPWFDTN